MIQNMTYTKNKQAIKSQKETGQQMQDGELVEIQLNTITIVQKKNIKLQHKHNIVRQIFI